MVEALLREAGADASTPPSAATWRAFLAAVRRRAIEPRAPRDAAAAGWSAGHHVLFAYNPVPMWMFDARTFQIIEVNDAMCRAYGYPRDELLGMTAAELKVPDEVPAMQLLMHDAPLGELRLLGLRTHRRKDGSHLVVEIHAHTIELEGRRVCIAAGVDKTEARMLEEQLRQAQKMEAVGQLAGGIAHDFNNILAVISTNAELARENLEPDHPVLGDIDEIATAAARAATLTRQLLAFSRKSKLQPRPLSLNAVVGQVQQMLARLVGEHIEIAIVLAPQLGTIDADPGQIEQLIMNLVVNARDAMPAGGKLVIETYNRLVDPSRAQMLDIVAGNFVALAVRDTGCGMSPQVRAHIFEPFFTTKSVDKGTGLGLATVFGIVKQSQGGIHVDSAPGAGTRFEILWPQAKGVAAAEDLEVRTSDPVGAGRTVLIVEDDDQLRQVLRRYLTRWGFDLLEAGNGPAALELARAHPHAIDLVLTDYVMPLMDGRTLAHELLAARPALAVIFMSGYTEHPALDRATFGAHDHFLQKPFTVRSLAAALALALPALA
jgi:PAS domain S-box-containing protein